MKRSGLNEKEIQDHVPVRSLGDRETRKTYLPPAKSFVVMSGGGVFFLVNNEDYYPSITKLSDVLGKYDVVWKGDNRPFDNL